MFGPIKRKAKEKEDPAERLREQEATARVYAEFVKSFQVEPANETKRFVRGGVVGTGAVGEDAAALEASASSNSLYTPPAAKKGSNSLWLPPASDAGNLKNSCLSAGSTPTAKRSVGASTARGTAAAGPKISALFGEDDTSEAAGAEDAAGESTGGIRRTLQTELGKGIGGIDGLIRAPGNASNSANCGSVTAGSSGGSKLREIDSFLEEIKRKQELLTQRRELRQIANNNAAGSSERENARRKLELLETQTRGKGSIPGIVEAEETTNLYLGNLSPEITEEYLCQQFGKFGAITSVKIMYPRSEEERARRRHCGFVSFERREMAEAARANLDGKEFFGMAIRIGWGKAVTKPLVAPTPISVGVASLSSVGLSAVSPIRGPGSSGFSDAPPDKEWPQKPPIQVVLPKKKRQRIVIDLVAQYVAEDGHLLEQALMERESGNEVFEFLFETDTEEALYYRWRVYAISQGDTVHSWRLEPYPMFFGGREWIPPPAEYFVPLPQEPKDDKRRSNLGIDHEDEAGEGPDRGASEHARALRGAAQLDEYARQELEDILRGLTRERQSILEAMAFCLDHSNCALEISGCLYESLTIPKTPLDLKVARLYLLSDLLHNSACSRSTAWTYRGEIERYLPEIFAHLNTVTQCLTGRLSIHSLKDRVMSLVRIWELWAVYPPLFTKGLEATFLKNSNVIRDMLATAVSPLDDSAPLFDVELDGLPVLPVGQRWDPKATSKSNVTMAMTELLAKYPYWLRENIREWLNLQLSDLQRQCKRRGLPSTCSEKSEAVVPEACEVGTTLGLSQTDEARDRASETLIQRLIAYEIFWRNKQINDAKMFQRFGQVDELKQP